MHGGRGKYPKLDPKCQADFCHIFFLVMGGGSMG